MNTKSVRFFLSIAILFALLLTACASAQSEPPSTTEVSTSGTFDVPTYATYSAVMYEAQNLSNTNFWKFYDYDKEDDVVEPGFVGLLYPSGIYNLSQNDYGQECVFEQGYDLIANSEKEVIVMGMKTTSIDENFQNWCGEQIPDSIRIYKITAVRTDTGFKISYSQEVWRLEATFELDESIR